MWGALIGAGVGLLQEKQKQKEREHDQGIAAVQTRGSPWSKLGAGEVKSRRGDDMMGAIGGGVMGYQATKSLAADKAAETATDKTEDAYTANQTPLFDDPEQPGKRRINTKMS